MAYLEINFGGWKEGKDYRTFCEVEEFFVFYLEINFLKRRFFPTLVSKQM